ncbi:MAG: PAS domain S-box protein [Dehalococcoidia bacterium]|nr:PAS domain S-box protein [Dehalococcoidia bacterium]
MQESPRPATPRAMSVTDVECPGAIFVVNAHGEIVFANAALRRLWPAGTRIRACGDDLPGPESPETEVRVRLGRADGPCLRLAVTCRPTVVERQVLYTCTAAESPRERFIAQAELSPFGVYVLRNGRFVYANSAFCALAGRRIDELAGTRAISLVPPEERRGLRRQAARIITGDSNHRYEYHLLAADGARRLVVETVRAVLWGGEPAIVGCCLAIEESTRAADLFRAATEHFERAESTLPEIFALAGVAGRFLFVNEAHQETLGYTRDELLGMRAQDLAHPEDQPELIRRMRKHIRNGTPLDFTFRIRRKDGGLRWFESRIEMIYDDLGRYAGTAVISNDVTARRRFVRRIAGVAAAARSPEEQLAAFASSLAHDGVELSLVSARAAAAGPGTGLAMPPARAGESLHAIAATLLAAALNPVSRRTAA